MERRVWSDVCRWSIIEALLVLALVWGSAVVFPFTDYEWFIRLGKLTCPENVYISLVFWDTLIRGVCFFFLIGVITKLKYHLSWSDIGLQKGIGENWWLVGIYQGLLLFLLMSLISILISQLFAYEAPPQQITEIMLIATSWRTKIFSILSVSVVAPLSEELYFRGFLYPTINRRTGKIPAVILTSMVFAFLHFDTIRFIPITIGGIWLNLLYIKTGSLYSSMIAHATWNTLMILLFFWAQSLGVA